MKNVSIVAMVVCVLMPLHMNGQERARSNAFILSGAQKQATPPELKINLSFNEPSGNGVLNAGETGQMVVIVANTGGTLAKDVKLRISTASHFEGVTYGKDFSVGDINPKEQKTLTVSFVAGKTLTDQKAVINVDATEAATQKAFAAAIEITTASGTQMVSQNAKAAFQPPTTLQVAQQPAVSQKDLETIRNLKNRLASNPNDGSARLQLVEILYNCRMWNDAVLEGARAIVSYPDQVNLYQYVGEGYRQLKKYPEALQYLSKGYSMTSSPSSDLGASYGLVLLRLGRVQEATVILRKAAQADANFINKRIASGNQEYGANDLNHATDEYFAALIVDRTRLTPEQTRFVLINADFKNFVETSDPDAATATFTDVVKRRLGEVLDYDELGYGFNCLVAAKQFEQAKDYYTSTMKLQADAVTQDSLDRIFLDEAYNLSGNNPDILNKIRIAFIRTVKSLYDLSEEEAVPIYALHEFVLKQGLVSAASEITSNLIHGTIRPENRYVRLADAFLKYRKLDDAKGTFNLMLKKRGLDKSGYGGDLAGIYSGLLNSQKNADAQDLMRQLNALDVSDVKTAYAKLAEIFTKEGQADKSIDILQKLIQTDPTNVALSIKLGDAFFAAERYDDIIASFANVKTKEGLRYLAKAYEKKYKLAEANKTWEELRRMSSDPKEITEIKKHIDDNLITMMNPDYATLQANANRPKSTAATTSAEKLKIVVDSPSNGFQTASNSVSITGRVLGAVTLQDVKINGSSVGTPRGMKVVETTDQTQTAQDNSKSGLPFAYVVALTQGKNDIRLQAFAPNGDSAETKLTVTMSTEAPKPMTIEEAEGIRQNKAYAVIIGVAHYESSEITPLNYTVNDAQALYDVLTDPNYGGFKKDNVTLLTDKEATTANIKKAIGANLMRAPDDGIAVVFFAGHGAPEGGQTYWLTYDTDPTSLYASTLSNTDIVQMLSRINTKRVVTFIDACYSGASVTTSKSTRAFIEDPFKAFEGQGTMTITSSDGNEESLEDAKLKHGIFTYRLIQALKGAADYNGDGIIMADEVARYIKQYVPDDARERSHKQDPVVVANYSGFIPISRNAENVLKNSKILQVQRFNKLYLDGKIDGASYKKIKDIIEGDNDAGKKPIKDYFDGVLTLKDLIDLIGK